MRKLAKVVLAATVVMSMGITAMAAPSVSSSANSVSATTEDGTAIDLVIEAASETVTADEAVEALGLDVDSSEVAILVQEITYSGGDEVFPLDITVGITGVTADMDVYVLHYYDGAWNEESAAAGDGSITIYDIGSLSPFAFVIADADATTSPTTGETSTTAVVMLAVVALGTAYVVSRRKVA